MSGTMGLFLNTGAFKVALKVGTIGDKMVINIEPISDEKKGRMTIKLNHITLFFDFADMHSVKDVYEALDEIGIHCTGSDKVWALKCLDAPSLLYPYQPIFAGAKKSVMKAMSKGKNDKKDFYRKIEADAHSLISGRHSKRSLGILDHLMSYGGSSEMLFKRAMSSLESKMIMETGIWELARNGSR